MTLSAVRGRVRGQPAAMEPAPEERDDGSLNTRPLTCGNVAGCERRLPALVGGRCAGVVKIQILPLSWARAATRRGVTTSALARSDDDRLVGGQWFVLADEEEAGGVVGAPEVDDHDTVL